MRGSTVAVSVVAALLLGALGFWLGQSTAQPSRAEWKDAVQDLRAQLETLSQALDAYQAEQAEQGAKLTSLERRVSALEERLASAESREAEAEAEAEEEGARAEEADGGFKVAYVDMFRVLQELQDSPVVRRALEAFREERARILQLEQELERQFEEGKITKKELDEKKFELQLRLQEINLQLSAPIQRQMLEVIRRIGQEKGYGLILDNPASQLNPIVLYSQAGQADDITQEVIERLKAQLEAQQPDQEQEPDQPQNPDDEQNP